MTDLASSFPTDWNAPVPPADKAPFNQWTRQAGVALSQHFRGQREAIRKISAALDPEAGLYVVADGKPGGQVVAGGTGPAETLELRSTTDSTPGIIYARDSFHVQAEDDVMIPFWVPNADDPTRLGICEGAHSDPITSVDPHPQVSCQRFTAAETSTLGTETPYVFTTEILGGDVDALYNLSGRVVANGTRDNAAWDHYDAVGLVGSAYAQSGNCGVRGIYGQAQYRTTDPHSYAVGMELGVQNWTGAQIPYPTGSAYGSTRCLVLEGSTQGVGSQYNSVCLHLSSGVDRDNAFWQGIYFGPHVIAPDGVAIDLSDIIDTDYVPIRMQIATGIYWRNLADTGDIKVMYVANDEHTYLCAKDTSHAILFMCDATQVGQIGNSGGFVNASLWGIRTSITPSSSADARGATGDIGWDANYIYVKTGTGWKRAAISTF